MINNKIKVFDLDGMIIRMPKFIADFEIKGNSKLNITLRSTGTVIHSGKYNKENNLEILIKNLEAEIENKREHSKVLSKIIEQIKGMYFS